ncbi:type I-C CRISPR-associated protein Cas5 [Clostridia bacterium]|nr:type I-C CRISPR-associated protein Cas5 [Clostridia bacterium]
MGFKIEVSGKYACFTRPELKVERYSYDFITPSAARGIVEAIYWEPAIRYVIDKISVCSPIHFENIRRNELKSKATYGNINKVIIANEDRTQRASTILRDVHYLITYHFEPAKLGERDVTTDGKFNHGKFADTIKRRLEKGQTYHQPYLGTREFPATVKIATPDIEPLDINKNFGLMLYDLEYINGTDDEIEFIPTYFVANMVKGVIDLRNIEVLK